MTISEELLKAYEAGLIELDHLRRVNKLKDEEIDAYQRKVKALEDFTALCEQQLQKQREIINNDTAIHGLNDKVVEQFKSLTADMKAELERVRKSRDAWRGRTFKLGTVLLIVGAALGYVLGGRGN